MKAPKGVFFMRHAWLILTHGNFEILEKQLRFLDSENADFYIHADAKAAFDPERFRAVPKKCHVRAAPPHFVGPFCHGRGGAGASPRRCAGRV